MRGKQLARQWKIVRLLECRKRGLTVREISKELDAGVRTIYRDLESIAEAGFPIYNEKVGYNSYWKILDAKKGGLDIPFTASELMSLHMSRDLLKLFEGTVFQESIETVLSKIRASLPEKVIRYLDDFSGKLRVGFSPAKDYASFRKVIAQLSEATAQRSRVQIRYRATSTGRSTTRRVDPYQVWAMNGSFYLIGLCHLRNSTRTFAMDRIQSLEVLPDTFHFPKDFNLEDYLQNAFRVMRGDPTLVKVWFAAGAAHVVRERIWHPTQEIREQPDGSLVVTLEVPINYEVVSWILGFGSAAEVLEPTSLKDRIRDELRKSLERYESDEDATTKIVSPKKIPIRVS